jgi:hypothetical protein
MNITDILSPSENRRLISLSLQIDSDPRSVMRAIIQNALGYLHPIGSLNDQLIDALNDLPNTDMIEEVQPDPQTHDLIDIFETAQLLKLSVSRVRVRSRKKGDPIAQARSRVGKQKPMHFSRSKIAQIERSRAA